MPLMEINFLNHSIHSGVFLSRPWLIRKPERLYVFWMPLTNAQKKGGTKSLTPSINSIKQLNSDEHTSRVKFLITSRPYLDIERRFANLVSSYPTIPLQGEQESDAISHEIDIVIRWRVLRLGSELKLNASEQSTLEAELLRTTHRTYLWLTLILDIVRETARPTSRKLKAVINNLPSTVHKAYESILSNWGGRKITGTKVISYYCCSNSATHLEGNEHCSGHRTSISIRRRS
jgi:hypothetical protein